MSSMSFCGFVFKGKKIQLGDHKVLIQGMTPQTQAWWTLTRLQTNPQQQKAHRRNSMYNFISLLCTGKDKRNSAYNSPGHRQEMPVPEMQDGSVVERKVNCSRQLQGWAVPPNVQWQMTGQRCCRINTGWNVLLNCKGGWNLAAYCNLDGAEVPHVKWWLTCEVGEITHREVHTVLINPE